MNNKADRIERKVLIVIAILAITAILFLVLTSNPVKADEAKRIGKTEWIIDPTSVKELIRISIQTQRLYFFKDGKLIHTFLCSTSSGPVEPRNVHPKRPHDHVGIFKIDSKERDHWSKKFRVHMPYALHFWHGHFIHQSNIVSKFGHPASHGCVRLKHEDAKWLYSQVDIGTQVEIR